MFQGLEASTDVAKFFNPPVGTGKPQPPAAKKFDAMPGADQNVNGIPQDEADRIAYEAGVSALAPILRRLKALETEVQELKQAQNPVHLKNVEKRNKV